MPFGGSFLMRGLGIRDLDRSIRDRRRGRVDTRSTNRRKSLSHNEDGDCGPGYDPTLRSNKHLHDSRRKSEGLPGSYAQRLFEYERPRLRRRGSVSPSEDHRGRAARDRQEFKLWLQGHPLRGKILARMAEQYQQGYAIPYGCTDLLAQMHGAQPRRNGLNHRRHDEGYDRQRGPLISDDRPPYGQRGVIDYLDPTYCPPYPPYPSNPAQRGATHLTHKAYKPHKNRRFQPSHTIERYLDRKDINNPPHPITGSRRNGAQQGRTHQPVRGPRRRHSRIHADHDHENEDNRTSYIRHNLHHHHHPSLEEYPDSDTSSSSSSSARSNRSFVRRQSANIIYPTPAPYHGHPLRHGGRPTTTTRPYADDSDDDEILHQRRRAGYVRDPIGIRRTVGRRDLDPDGLDYGLSGDENDDLLL